MKPVDLPALLREQREYYGARAAEYDDAYRRTARYDRVEETNASWQADMARLAAAFDMVPLTGDIVELAAGSGHWTERLVTRAQSLTVIDGSAELLLVNRKRLGANAATITYEVADLFEWRPPRTWDACVFCFWLCHVPDERVRGFLRVVADAVRDDGLVCFIDKVGDSDAQPGERVERVLNDGRRFTIVDHPRRPEELVALFVDADLDIEVETIGARFCLARGTRRRRAARTPT